MSWRPPRAPELSPCCRYLIVRTLQALYGGIHDPVGARCRDVGLRCLNPPIAHANVAFTAQTLTGDYDFTTFDDEVELVVRATAYGAVPAFINGITREIWEERGFTVAEPDKVWAGDITYLHTDEGSLVLARLIVHSDRGSQYASLDFRDELTECGFSPAMSRHGNCWDKACGETLFGSMSSTNSRRRTRPNFPRDRRARRCACRIGKLGLLRWVGLTVAT